MEFKYTEFSDGIRRPTLPITFRHKGSFSVGYALVDTGADITILPMEIAEYLGIDVDLNDKHELGGAGGGRFLVHPSPVRVEHILSKEGCRDKHWHGRVFFCLGQRAVLLGHRDCLEKFDLTFRGPEKTLEVQPRF